MAINFIFIILGCLAIASRNYIKILWINAMVTIVGLFFYSLFLLRINPYIPIDDAIIYILFLIFSGLMSWYLMRFLFKKYQHNQIDL